MLTSTTQEFDVRAGVLYYFSITGHNGHTTKIQLNDELGWHDVPDNNEVIEHTTAHMGSFRMPNSTKIQVHISGGTGDLCITFAGYTTP